MNFIDARNLAKTFRPPLLFRDLSFTVNRGESLAVTGPNGSGKSTLLMILAGFMTPERGTIHRQAGERILNREEFLGCCGFSGPRHAPYGNLTGRENILYVTGRENLEEGERLCRELGLSSCLDREVHNYSSGMVQRLRYVLALANKPAFLLLDEPTASLDRDGKELLLQDLRSRMPSLVLVLATNDEEEAGLCGSRVELHETTD
jgi:heme exporter protein A